ncbi:MAG: transcriptional repressor LexA [Geminicoccaceae bacterium]
MLTKRQQQLMLFIQDYIRDNTHSPSFEEMRRALRLKSKSGVHRLLSGLEERGFIRRLAYRARALEIVKPLQPADQATPPNRRAPGNVVQGVFSRKNDTLLRGASGNVPLPLYGRIAAGTPIEALADTSTVIDVPGMMLDGSEHYVLQVVGDSMVEAGILDGDMVVIKRGDSADSGDIVVALIDEREATLKRLRRRGASIALEPANPSYETRIFGPQQVKVQGRLVGLLRRY